MADGKTIDMLTYKVMVLGEEETIDVNRKADGAKPVAGDVLEGTIEDSDFGKRFKATPKSFGGASSSYAPRDDGAIQAQFAIKAAIALLRSDKDVPPMSVIEDSACQFFAMIDRVKNSKPTASEPALTPPGDLKSDGGFKASEDDF